MTDDDGIDPERLERELAYMKDLIASDPEVHSRFDIDGNGIIDSDEWLKVRDMVIARLQREEEERRAILERWGEAPAPNDESSRDTTDHPAAEPMPELEGFTPPDPLPVGQIAGRIYRSDLRRLHVDERNKSLDQLDSFAALRSVVLRTQNPFHYSICSISGDEVGVIECTNSGIIEEIKARLPLGGRDWIYSVDDRLANTSYRLEVDAGLTNKKARLFDATGTQSVTATRGPRLVRSKVAVQISRTGERLVLRQSALDDWNVIILDEAGNELGEMDKDVESFVDAVNPFGKEVWRIDVEETVSNDAMVSIILGAVFVDTDQYDKNPSFLM